MITARRACGKHGYFYRCIIFKVILTVLCNVISGGKNRF